MTEGAGPDFDPQRLYEQLERAILGSPRTFTRVEVAEAADVPLARAEALWRALGFSGSTSDEEKAYTDADIEALRLVTWLVECGFIDPSMELTLVRSMGRSFARLAEWEVAELTAGARRGQVLSDQDQLEDLIARLVPVIEDIQRYVWRRHIAGAAGRMLLTPGGGDGVRTGVGFADIVGFTRRSRGLSAGALARLIESFEATSAAVVTEHSGRVIKTIGDEVLFVTDAPVDAARIALALVEAPQHVEGFPEVRVGVAYGDVLCRLGDVFGPVVNVAARLTSIARPSRVLIDRGLREALREHEDEFRIRRSRTAAVRGYSRLDTWTLKRPRTHPGSEPPRETRPHPLGLGAAEGRTDA